MIVNVQAVGQYRLTSPQPDQGEIGSGQVSQTQARARLSISCS